MKLILENIGMLRHAELTLHKLCVIAGENDNGKSTVGKILFCIVKAINRYREDLLDSKESRIQEKVMELYFVYRRAAAHRETILHDEKKLYGLLYKMRSFQIDLATLFQQLDEIESNFELNSKEKESARRTRHEISKIYEEPENKEELIERAFKRVFTFEFDGHVLAHGAKRGSIRLFENEITIIDLEVSEKNTVKLRSEVALLEFSDATFVESPLILNHYDLLVGNRASTASGRRANNGATALHTTDLFQKLRLSVVDNYDLFNSANQVILNELEAIIKGEIAYNKDARNFIFNRNKQNIVIKNTASGIKVFGILQILLKNEFLAKNTVVIFDEPENHLHPKWQIRLAKLLVTMAKNGIYVMVSSHSPYMIEGLKRYADREEVTAGYYLSENNRISDEDRLNDIFRILSEPFETFRNMDAEELRGE